jgi:hypothetical protein
MKRKSAKIATEKVVASKPKKLSKAGEWRLRNPNGLGVTILDMRAVMR